MYSKRFKELAPILSKHKTLKKISAELKPKQKPTKPSLKSLSKKQVNELYSLLTDTIATGEPKLALMQIARQVGVRYKDVKIILDEIARVKSELAMEEVDPEEIEKKA